MDCLSGAAVAISDELVSSITQVVNLFLERKCPMMLGEYIASAPLTPLIKPSGGIRPIAVGTVWRGLVSKDRGDDVGLSMLLVDFQNAFNLVDRTVMLEEVRLRCPAISRWVEFCYSSPARLYYGEHFLWSSQGVQQGDPLGPLLFYLVLHPLICKIRDSFNLCLQAWYLDDGTIVGDTLVVDPRSRLEGVFPPNISRPLHGVKLLGGPVSVDADFSSALVMKRVSKTIGLLDTVAKINDPQCDVLNYAFIASRLQSTALQTKLLRHVDIVAIGSTFDDALCMFNNAMGIDFLSNSSEVAAPKLMKKMADIYFTQVTKDVESSFCLSPRQMALWQSQREEHTSDWLRVVPISGLGQTMNGKTYRCVLCYRLGVPLFSVSKPCSACSKVFTGDVYGDHAVSCAGVIGIKHRHNAVRDTLVDICFRSGISAGKEVDIGLGGGRDKALRPADMLLYSWEGGLDVCVDLTGSSPLTQTGMADFVPGRAVIDAARRKRVKYMTKCADIGYGFLPFSFSSFGELEKDAVTLLKRVRKFSIAQDIGGRAAVHIFNRIGFSIAKGVGAQIVSRLPSNLFKVTYVVRLLMFGFLEMMTLPIALQDKTKSARDGLKTTHTDSGANEESKADDISLKVKLEDLSILKDTRSAFFTPDSPPDEPIIISDESEEEEEVAKDKDTKSTSHDVPKDTSVPPSPSLKLAQIQELMAQVYLLQSQKEELEQAKAEAEVVIGVWISQKSQENSQKRANTDTRIRRVQKEAKDPKP
ncbi:putative reverse transcriptase domain-containing protein [Tanacetum coccineum]|uniref:Reverse transcriptase domain-containing protein n=1 Tax=Tanacetum coccineum TaxID=301880 RepID=A0ABQ5F426_9ASTR